MNKDYTMHIEKAINDIYVKVAEDDNLKYGSEDEIYLQVESEYIIADEFISNDIKEASSLESETTASFCTEVSREVFLKLEEDFIENSLIEATSFEALFISIYDEKDTDIGNYVSFMRLIFPNEASVNVWHIEQNNIKSIHHGKQSLKNLCYLQFTSIKITTLDEMMTKYACSSLDDKDTGKLIKELIKHKNMIEAKLKSRYLAIKKASYKEASAYLGVSVKAISQVKKKKRDVLLFGVAVIKKS